MHKYLDGTSVWYYRGSDPDHRSVRLMWLVLMNKADEYGESDCSLPALARDCGIEEEEARRVLEFLKTPGRWNGGEACIEDGFDTWLNHHTLRVVGYEMYSAWELKGLKEEAKERKKVERMVDREEARKKAKSEGGGE